MWQTSDEECSDDECDRYGNDKGRQKEGDMSSHGRGGVLPCTPPGKQGGERLNQNLASVTCQDSASSLAGYKGSCSSVCSHAGTTFDRAPAWS